MIPKTRFRRGLRVRFARMILAAATVVAGCSTSASDGSGGSVNHITVQGTSVSGWLASPGASDHSRSATNSFIAVGNAGGCTECHGADLLGGISRVSCMSNPSACHHGTVDNWVVSPAGAAAQQHGASAKRGPGSSSMYACQICHGNDFAGTISAPSCLNNAACHGAGVVPPHPLKWRTSTGGASNHDSTNTANAPVCYGCHAYTGTPNPNNPAIPTSPASAGTAPGCFNGTMCHNEAGHTVPFNTTVHYSVTDTTFAANCGICHAVTGAPPVSGAPLCTTCHIAGSPLTALSCTSCHADPPSGATTAYPNAAGAHAMHIALSGAGTPIACDTCHNGLGTDTLDHYNRANARPGENALRVPPGDVAFPATYSAKTGASSFDNSASLNCSNVSCHGGQATPNWQAGTLNVNNQCESCHVSGTTQYNSYNSGEHPKHIGEFGATASTCKLCHNTTTLAVNHFTALGTATMEGPSSATIGGAGTAIVSWNPTTKSCSPSCHGTKTW